MKNNYPIKYAIIPITEQNNRLEDEIVYYVAIKCYVIGEHKIYRSNGEEIVNYDVVSPYKKIYYDKYKRQAPIDGEYIEHYNVSNLYDFYEEAKLDKEKMIDVLYNQKRRQIRLTDNKKEILNLLLKSAKAYYDELEKKINKNTDDLLIGVKNKPQRVILAHQGSAKELDESIYNVMDIYKDYSYAIRTIDQRDYISILFNINNGSEISSSLGELLIVNDPNTKVKKIYDGENYMYIKDNKTSLKAGDSIKFASNPEIVFYTLEDFYDIKKSYEKYNHTFTLKREK